MKGNTGEFYALAELSRHGWTAAQTARNTRIYDILARKGSRQVAIRVKTKTSDAQVFQWNAKKDGVIFVDIGKDDYCILVDIPESYEDFPQFYVLRTAVLDRWLKVDFKEWTRNPRHSPDNPNRVLNLDGDPNKPGRGYAIKLKPYLARWEILN